MVTQSFEFNPDWTSPVGETILESMEARDWDQSDLAAAMCVDPLSEEEYSLNYCILDLMFYLPDENMLMSQDTADGLQRAFNVPASFWLARHEQHRFGLHGELPSKTRPAE